MRPTEQQVLVRNRKARHEYEVIETVEAGIELRGSEVKSLRAAAASMSDAYAQLHDGQMYLLQMQINEYKEANRWNHDPKRERRLLLHKEEIEKLGRAIREKGYTLIPLEVYLKNGRIKVLLGMCRGKKLYDRRQTSKERDAQREIERELRR
ncbi:MAG TPA: SsrA-binding protein SmpB [Polyangia bacterium]|jgi:SsrA-binding protein|nr:SsrA-binding protein SmpB [Polyangia bacterium]